MKCGESEPSRRFLVQKPKPAREKRLDSRMSSAHTVGVCPVSRQGCFYKLNRALQGEQARSALCEQWQHPLLAPIASGEALVGSTCWESQSSEL